MVKLIYKRIVADIILCSLSELNKLEHFVAYDAQTDKVYLKHHFLFKLFLRSTLNIV